MMTRFFEKDTLADIAFLYSMLTGLLSIILCILICAFLIKMYIRMDKILEDL